MLSTVSPAKLNSPCAFMLNKSHFSTIKILSIPASGIPKKCLTFSHKPLWRFSSYRHRHSALGWSLRASPTASSRGKTITSCSVCAEGSQKQKPTHTYTHFFFSFLSINLSLQINSCPAQSAGKYARSSCSSWRFQIFIFSKDGSSPPAPQQRALLVPVLKSPDVDTQFLT